MGQQSYPRQVMVHTVPSRQVYLQIIMATDSVLRLHPTLLQWGHGRTLHRPPLGTPRFKLRLRHRRKHKQLKRRHKHKHKRWVMGEVTVLALVSTAILEGLSMANKYQSSHQ